MTEIWNQLNLFVWNILHRPTLTDIIDILIVAVLLYQLVLIIRGTRGVQVLKGVAFVVLLSYISEIIGLKTMSWAMRSILNNGVLALLVLFQPEARKALEQLGRGTKLDRKNGEHTENEHIIGEITRSVLNLSKRKVGALIVFEGKTGLQDVIDTGTPMEASISAALMENIFEPKTPLHDGAAVLRGPVIAAAACMLPLSESSDISSSLGTRHRAGLGVTESTDASVIIVSEETGAISLARNGQLTRFLDENALRSILSKLYPDEDYGIRTKMKTYMRRLFGREGGEAR